jgi:hypothetical protein
VFRRRSDFLLLFLLLLLLSPDSRPPNFRFILSPLIGSFVSPSATKESRRNELDETRRRDGLSRRSPSHEPPILHRRTASRQQAIAIYFSVLSEWSGRATWAFVRGPTWTAAVHASPPGDRPTDPPLAERSRRFML